MTKEERQRVDYTPLYQRFVYKKKSYTQQYSHLYVNRLHVLRKRLSQTISADRNDVPLLPKIIDLQAGVRCIITGTVLKVLKNKPRLFEALISSEQSIDSLLNIGKLASDQGEDQIILEDDSGRVELSGDMFDPDVLVTGVVVAVQGQLGEEVSGFQVQKVFYPYMKPQKPLVRTTKSQYVALVSGLSIGSGSISGHPVRTQLLFDYLAGRIGTGEELSFVSSIVHTIIVGNSVSSAPPADSVRRNPYESPTCVTISTSFDRKKDKKASQIQEYEVTATPLRDFDQLLSTLVCTMRVDLMPGHSDPSNYSLPQQAFHECLLPNSSSYSSLRLVTNPYDAEVGNIRFLGHAGQPVESIMQSTGNGIQELDTCHPSKVAKDNVLDCLERCLLWNHLAPTAPDMLSCFPAAQDDPFIVDEMPHVFFAGNQKHFETRMWNGAGNENGVRIVSVPSFSETLDFGLDGYMSAQHQGSIEKLDNK
uniref:DNA polymerase alpha/epsilon subunit B putative n=1 Tax=Albugo laibachii Nc14 TaxID=890382 RepID=F0W458_9STRA|nr:DNA polymerase alpha/epsilon subunit B putative [Albugo laibachii Nc14]|eukprot:CCA15856.1 DNA polymerase alpha/epsilon subunit B putative [Albugo laibachii Nc14]